MNNYKKTIIDVRSPEEFKNGNVAGSINIPLNEIQQRIEEIKWRQSGVVQSENLKKIIEGYLYLIKK